MTPKRAAVIYHPISTPLERVRRVVIMEERRHGWGSTRWYETSGDDSGRRAAHDALADDPDVVIIAGGDGTVRVVAEVVLERDIPIALLPTGTGNLLARNTNIPLNDA